MSFYVDAAAVAGLSALVTRNGGGAQLFANYNKGSGPNEFGEGVLINLCAQSLDRWQQLARDNSQRGADLLLGCGHQLEHAAELYAGVDHEYAAKLDATYPHGGGAAPLEPGQVRAADSAGEFTDWENPSSNPRDPSKEYQGPPTLGEADAAGSGWNIDLEGEVDRVTGAVSLARQIRDVLRAILGLDPFDVALTLIAGHWELLLYQARCVEDLDPGFTRIRENLDRGRFAVQDRWEGNAAGAFEVWMLNYCLAADELATFGREAGWKMRNFAEAAYHQFQALNIAIDFLIDLVLDLVLAGGGTMIGGALSVLRGENPIEAIGSIVAAYGQVSTILDAIRVLGHELVSISDVVAGNGEAVARSWPTNPSEYVHPEFR